MRGQMRPRRKGGAFFGHTMLAGLLQGTTMKGLEEVSPLPLSHAVYELTEAHGLELVLCRMSSSRSMYVGILGDGHYVLLEGKARVGTKARDDIDDEIYDDIAQKIQEKLKGVWANVPAPGKE